MGQPISGRQGKLTRAWGNGLWLNLRRVGKGQRIMRGFLSGVIWGSGVAALGLGALSQLTPLSVSRIEVDATTVLRQDPVVVVAPETAPADAVAAVQPNTAAPLPADPDKPISDVVDAPAGSEFAKPLPDTDPVAPEADNAPAPEVTPFAPAALPAPDKGAAAALPTAAPETGLQAPKPLEVPAIGADAAPVANPAEGAKIAFEMPDQPNVSQPEVAPTSVPDQCGTPRRAFETAARNSACTRDAGHAGSAILARSGFGATSRSSSQGRCGRKHKHLGPQSRPGRCR